MICTMSPLSTKQRRWQCFLIQSLGLHQLGNLSHSPFILRGAVDNSSQYYFWIVSSTPAPAPATGFSARSASLPSPAPPPLSHIFFFSLATYAAASPFPSSSFSSSSSPISSSSCCCCCFFSLVRRNLIVVYLSYDAQSLRQGTVVGVVGICTA